MSSLIRNLAKDLSTLSTAKSSEINDFYKQADGQKSEYDLLEKVPDTKSILDLDLIVEKWINYMWEKTKSKSDAKYDFEELNIVIDWKRCDINQNDALFDKNSKGKVRSQTLFRTFFTNKTDSEQEYSFRTERTTHQSCSFSFMKGFSREKEAGISFKLPDDIVEIGGGIRSEQSIEMGKDETKEESVTWGVDSIIKVRPHSKTSAELVINELEMDRNFKVEMNMKGRLSVLLYSKKDSAFIKSMSGDISQILHLAIDKFWMPADTSKCIKFAAAPGGEMVYFEFSGKCKFRLGVEQHVQLSEEDL